MLFYDNCVRLCFLNYGVFLRTNLSLARSLSGALSLGFALMSILNDSVRGAECSNRLSLSW